jgi:hypothetical protein
MAAGPDAAERVADEVRALEGLDIDGLRAAWRRCFGAPPPALRAPKLLLRCLADRIQSQALGDDPDLERRLAVMVRAHDRGERPKSAPPHFRPGTSLVREHDGKTHRVEVLEKGFSYDGKRWKSLSQIARAITGVRWNGPRFFGLQDFAAGTPDA